MRYLTEDDRLLEDIKTIKEMLGHRCKKVAIFGSTIKRGLGKATDIDLALFLEAPSAEYVINCLKNAKLNYRFNSKRVAFSYGGGGGIKEDGNIKEFDMVVLDNKNPDSTFMLKNDAFLRYVH